MAERLKKIKFSSVVYNKFFKNNVNNNNKNAAFKIEMTLYLLCFFISRNSVADELFPFAVSFLCAYFFYKGHSLLMLSISIMGILSAKGNLVYAAVLFFVYIYYVRNNEDKQKNIVFISVLTAVVLFLSKSIVMIIEGFNIEMLIINVFEGMLVLSSIYILHIGISSLNIVGYIKKDGEKTICFFITVFLALIGLKDIYISDLQKFKITLDTDKYVVL